MNRNTIAAVVIGGGAGARLGGVVKPLLRAGGRTILAANIARLRGYASPVLVSIGPIEAARFASCGADALVSDRPDASGGPLAGLFAAATHLRQAGAAPDWLVSLAGDCPDLPDDLVSALVSATTDGIDVVFAGFAGEAYPPNAIWRFATLLARMDGLGGDPQGRGPCHLVPPERRRDLDFVGRLSANPFEGLNTRADLVALARRRRGSKPA
ncbi:MAG: NTP transferase domain-containing protein [Alphaproteobacteria bacterium]|nr:NTP transferase domain-containing protein [Alphaproteobacteria bacterium]